jgi:TAG lipase/steryl ester hydrolase/phospholipase A2/LPA acyltransferase
MTVLGDSTVVHSQCHQLDLEHDHPSNRPAPYRSLRKAISIPAVSLLVKDSWNWAGETLNTYRDGLSTEQRKQREEVENRKQLFYLKIKNVSNACC